MKKQLLFLTVCIIFSASLGAQAPQGLNYQAVARDAGGNTLQNRLISVRLTIHDASVSGAVVYQETDTVTTNRFGLFTLMPGQGNVVTGAFEEINWGGGGKFLQVEIDGNGGSEFKEMGTTQLMSVPYALYAAKAGRVESKPEGGVTGNWNLVGNAGTLPGTNFLGTTDTEDLQFKINSIQAGRLALNGNSFYGLKAGLSASSAFSNVAIGVGALYSDTGAWNTVAIGDSALYSQNGAPGGVPAAYNVGVGSKTLMKNVTGFSNTALGYTSLMNNTTGSSNTAIGEQVMVLNTTGVNNTAVGSQALYKNTSGNYNSVLGIGAMFDNTTGSQNTATGNNALSSNTTGSNNTIAGAGGLDYNTTGSNNTGMGYNSLGYNSSGNSNVAVGIFALYSNTTGSNLVALGDSALYSDAGTGTSNTALGSKALLLTTSGSGNTAAGKSALTSNTTGSYNTAVGLSALTANTTGSHNVGVGYLTGDAVITGSGITDIGYEAYATSDVSNYTGIGYMVGTASSASNMVELGNGSVTVIRGAVSFSTYSDGRIKENVQENVPGLNFIKLLHPVTYNYNIHKEAEITSGGIKKPDSDRDWEGKYDIERMTMSGFIAQDVESAAKSIGYNFSGVVKPANANDLYSLRYSEFVVPMVKAIQEQEQTIETQQLQIQALQKQYAEVMKKLTQLGGK